VIKIKVVAFLPAKGTSSRIKSKNMKLLDGKPLFYHTLEKLTECDFIDEVYLDSESEEVFDLASSLNFKKMKRDPKLANNKTDGHSLFYNEAKQVDADIYIQILGTSPFITKETIKKGVEILKNEKKYDSVVLIKKEKQYTWNENGPNYDKNNIPNSVDLKDTIIETMGLYITNKKVAIENKKRIGNTPYLLEANALEAVDVNYPDEFELADYIMRGKREKENEKFRNLSKILNSALLSDVMDDLGINGFIRDFKLNLENKKIMGRAKTLKIRLLKEGESLEGIYSALNSYETIVPNDIIIVENEAGEYAYFGNLNANLAINRGAIGTIIDGKTRDYTDVKNLDYPVFSKGYVSKDVKGRATMESFNKKIKIQNIEIRPGDLIFADIEGIIIIPKEKEQEVINKALKSLKVEKNIIIDILEGKPINKLVEDNGNF
jgi:CMP-N-acetylneuraminic acid synthetase